MIPLRLPRVVNRDRPSAPPDPHLREAKLARPQPTLSKNPPGERLFAAKTAKLLAVFTRASCHELEAETERSSFVTQPIVDVRCHIQLTRVHEPAPTVLSVEQQRPEIVSARRVSHQRTSGFVPSPMSPNSSLSRSRQSGIICLLIYDEWFGGVARVRSLSPCSLHLT